FVDQVEQGNVSQVSIQGSEITGTFKHARRWDPQTGLLVSYSSKGGSKKPAPGAASEGKTKHEGGTQTAPKPPGSVHPGKTSAAVKGAGPEARAQPKVASQAAARGASHMTPAKPPGSTASVGPSGKAAPSPSPNGGPGPSMAAPPPPKPVEVTHFTTVFPSSVGDPGLLPLLEQHGVEVVAKPPGPHWLGDLLGALFPTLLLVGFLWWMGRRAMNQQQSIFGMGKSQARRFHKEGSPAVTFDDVAGADGSKAQLQEIVELLKAPERFQSLGARIPRGVLLIGPPGAVTRPSCRATSRAHWTRSSWATSAPWPSTRRQDG
ncbi:MAG: hypothetical protein P8Y25_14590, partial [Chromatiaceae bacterium]